MILSALPTLVLISNILFVFFVLAIFFRKSWGKSIAVFLGENAILFGFLTILASIAGSLFYSNIVGYDPCILCWWQRIFIYPQAIIFFVAMMIKDKKVFSYIVPMAIIVLLISLYHSYLQMGGTSVIPCDAVGPSCSKVYVMAYGYITIPFMAVTISAYVLLLAWAYKLYENRNA